MHGEFGSVGNWRNSVGDRPAERPAVEAWIANNVNTPAITSLSAAIALRTQINAPELADYIRNDLLLRIDEVVASNASRPARPLASFSLRAEFYRCSASRPGSGISSMINPESTPQVGRPWRLPAHFSFSWRRLAASISA